MIIAEQLSEEFIERMVDKVIARLGDRFEELDISLDFIAAILADRDAVGIGVAQQSLGRFAKTGRGRVQTAPTQEDN